MLCAGSIDKSEVCLASPHSATRLKSFYLYHACSQAPHLTSLPDVRCGRVRMDQNCLCIASSHSLRQKRALSLPPTTMMMLACFDGQQNQARSQTPATKQGVERARGRQCLRQLCLWPRGRGATYAKIMASQPFTFQKEAMTRNASSTSNRGSPQNKNPTFLLRISLDKIKMRTSDTHA